MRYKKDSFTITPNKHYLKGKDGKFQSIYFWICEHADEDGVCYPGRKLLAEEAGTTVKTVDLAIKMFVDDGVLVKTSRKKPGTKQNLSNLYQIMIIEGVVAKKTPPSSDFDPTPSSENDTVTIPIRTIPNNIAGDTPAGEKNTASIPVVIKAFEGINPTCKRYYGNKTQRKACDELISHYGTVRVVDVVSKALPKTNAIAYFPTITTPLQLLEKWSILESAINKHNNRKHQQKEKTGVALW